MTAKGRRPDLLAGERLPAKPRQRRSVAKRKRLETAALSLFRERGYDGTSIDAIVRRARLAVGGFYQHYQSKRQLLIALMHQLVERLGRLELTPIAGSDVRSELRALIAGAFGADVEYLGAYRAWQEAVLSDPDLSEKDRAIRDWTSARVAAVFTGLQRLPGARRSVAIAPLARAMDSFFWSMIGDAARAPGKPVDEAVDAATHLIYHAFFVDGQRVSRS